MELAAQDQESEQVSGLAPGVDGAGGEGPNTIWAGIWPES